MSETRTQRLENSIDRAAAGAIVLSASPGNMMTIAPQNMGELFEFAKLMAISGECIPKIFRDKPGACLAIALQAFRTGADPFAVANKAYLVNDRIAYEAQYIHAVLNTSGKLKKRLRPTYEGEGSKLRCIVRGEINGEDEPFEYRSPEIGNISVQNSPLWKADREQQLFYFASRAWARRHLPEVILGMDTGADIEMAGNMRDVTPPPRPTREEFERAACQESTASAERAVDAERTEHAERPGGDIPDEPEIPLYELINCDGETVICTRDTVEDNILAIFAEAEKRGDGAIEAAIENNEGVIDATMTAAQHEANMMRAYLKRQKDPVPAEVLDPEPKPPEAHRDEAGSSSETKAGPTSGGRRERPERRPPRQESAASYTLAPLYERDGKTIAYAAWWHGRFLNCLREAKTADEITERISANGETIQGYYATLSPGALIAAMKQLDDIQKAAK